MSTGVYYSEFEDRKNSVGTYAMHGKPYISSLFDQAAGIIINQIMNYITLDVVRAFQMLSPQPIRTNGHKPLALSYDYF